MRIKRAVDLCELQGRIAERPTDWALLLDIDGTMLDIAGSPDDVLVPVSLVDSLSRLSLGLDHGLALITGRSIESADRLLAPLRLAAAGIHGAELRKSPNGEVERTQPLMPIGFAAKVEQLARTFRGVQVERKSTALSLHYRSSGACELELEANVLALIASEALPVRIQRGRRVLELLPAQVSKANALDAIVRLPAFRGRRLIVIGDDAADEPCLAIVDCLGGFGLRVAGEHFHHREADFCQPAEVRTWLDGLSVGISRN